MVRVGWFTGDFSIVDLSQSHPSSCLSALFIYPCLFLSGFPDFSPCLALEEDKDTWLQFCACVLCAYVLQSSIYIHTYIRTCTHESLCASSNMCAFLFVSSIYAALSEYMPVVSVVITVDPQLHNRELHPTQSLKLHRRDPCDLRYLQPPSQLLGAKMKCRQTETLFFPFGVKRKCGNKKQKSERGKHVLNSENFFLKKENTDKHFVSWPHIQKSTKSGTSKSRG